MVHRTGSLAVQGHQHRLILIYREGRRAVLPRTYLPADRRVMKSPKSQLYLTSALSWTCACSITQDMLYDNSALDPNHTIG